jgi:hypothetical protein
MSRKKVSHDKHWSGDTTTRVEREDGSVSHYRTSKTKNWDGSVTIDRKETYSSGPTSGYSEDTTSSEPTNTSSEGGGYIILFIIAAVIFGVIFSPSNSKHEEPTPAQLLIKKDQDEAAAKKLEAEKRNKRYITTNPSPQQENVAPVPQGSIYVTKNKNEVLFMSGATRGMDDFGNYTHLVQNSTNGFQEGTSYELISTGGVAEPNPVTYVHHPDKVESRDYDYSCALGEKKYVPNVGAVIVIDFNAGCPITLIETEILEMCRNSRSDYKCWYNGKIITQSKLSLARH